jgi:hypothetical protein
MIHFYVEYTVQVPLHPTITLFSPISGLIQVINPPNMTWKMWLASLRPRSPFTSRGAIDPHREPLDLALPSASDALNNVVEYGAWGHHYVAAAFDTAMGPVYFDESKVYNWTEFRMALAYKLCLARQEWMEREARCTDVYYGMSKMRWTEAAVLSGVVAYLAKGEATTEAWGPVVYAEDHAAYLSFLRQVSLSFYSN